VLELARQLGWRRGRPCALLTRSLLLRGRKQKSKSVAKRQKLEQEADAADKDVKRLRLEMRRRGHVAVATRGQDPAQDAREKLLARVATKGVVRLFNAVSKAQREQREAARQGRKPKVRLAFQRCD
jgi:Rrp15p